VAADRAHAHPDRARGAAAVVFVQDAAAGAPRLATLETFSARSGPAGRGGQQETIMASQAQASGRGRTIGWVLSGLVIAFLLMDATMKLLALPIVLETQEPLGFSGAGLARGLGVLLLACTLLYAAPQTA